MATSWDLFFSYRRHDLERARPLLEALTHAGVRVWRDENDIPEQGSITAEIRHGIANSKAVLALYSRTYPASNPCQEELITAWLAAHQMDADPHRRVWIVNPETSIDHLPNLFRDQQISVITGDRSQYTALASQTKERLDALDDTLLGHGFRDLPSYYGLSPVQARHFVGRARELWDLHGQLTGNRISIITGVYGQAASQVRGLGGNGKSLLAREYCIRFGRAYPGGVFWLSAYGHDDTKGSLNAEQREALRQDQIREFALQLNVATEGKRPSEIEVGFWQAIQAHGKRCLWIVDDMPSGLSPDEMQKTWHARWVGSSTLVTTRSKEYGALGEALDLGVLSPGEAFGLLCSQRQPKGSAEERAAQQIVELLGYHPLAVDVAGSYLVQGIEDFESYRQALANPREDAVEFGKVLKETLPTGHERSISATLLKSIRQLDAEGLDFLRLASVLAVAPIPVDFASEVFEIVEEPNRMMARALALIAKIGLRRKAFERPHRGEEAKRHALRGVNQSAALSLCERSGEEARVVHTLVSRTMRFQFPGEKRTSQLRSAAVQVLTQRLARIGHVGEYSRIVMDMPHARHLVTTDLQTEKETRLALWVAKRDYERADYGSAGQLEEQVLAARRRVLGEEHPDTLTAMNNLAGTLFAQGDLAGARQLQEQVLAALRRVLGEEHPNTLGAMNNLAQTLKAQGDLATFHQLARSIRTR